MLFCIVFNANLVDKRMQATLNHSYCQYMQLCYMLIYYACNRLTFVSLKITWFLLHEKSFVCIVGRLRNLTQHLKMLLCKRRELKKCTVKLAWQAVHRKISPKKSHCDSVSVFFLLISYSTFKEVTRKIIYKYVSRGRDEKMKKKHILDIMLLTQRVFEVVVFRFDFLSMIEMKLEIRYKANVYNRCTFIVFFFHFLFRFGLSETIFIFGIFHDPIVKHAKEEWKKKTFVIIEFRIANNVCAA